MFTPLFPVRAVGAQDAYLGLVAVDVDGHFDANQAGRDAVWLGAAGLPPADRSRGGEALDALHRPGLLLRTLTPGS